MLQQANKNCETNFDLLDPKLLERRVSLVILEVFPPDVILSFVRSSNV